MLSVVPDRVVPSAPDQQANPSVEPQKVVPAEDVMEQDENGQPAIDARKQHAELVLLHSLMGHYGRQLWDIQHVRIAMGNRVAAMDHDGVPVAHQNVAKAQVEALESAEHAIELELQRIARRHPMRSWIEGAPGIGLGGFARLLAITGSLDRFATVSKLWKYLGLAVMDGHRQRMSKGQVATHTNCQGGHLQWCKPDCQTDHHPNCSLDGFGNAYAPKGLVLCHQIGDSIVKTNRGPYREAYDRKKADYEQNRPDWTQAHRHEAAKRYAVKELLKGMWLEWRCRVVFDTRMDAAPTLAA